MSLYIIGVDLAKEVFHLHGADKYGRQIFSKTLKRKDFDGYIKNISPCMIVMEACGGANHWARLFASYGHEIKIISPQYVKPFVLRNKNDRIDARAIVEAALRPSAHFVGIKSKEQQDIQCIHRARQRLVWSRTAVVQEIRGFLLEYGISIPISVAKFRKALPEILEDANSDLGDVVRQLLLDLYNEYKFLDSRVLALEKSLKCIGVNKKVCSELRKIPGIGPITSTALYCEIGDPRVYKNGRQLAASLGLVPKHKGSGGKVVMGRISKRGNSHIRQLMVHGSRSIVSKVKLGVKEYENGNWIRRIEQERGFNKACLALANKNARWAWHVLMGHELRVAN